MIALRPLRIGEFAEECGATWTHENAHRKGCEDERQAGGLAMGGEDLLPDGSCDIEQNEQVEQVEGPPHYRGEHRRQRGAGRGRRSITHGDQSFEQYDGAALDANARSGRRRLANVSAKSERG